MACLVVSLPTIPPDPYIYDVRPWKRMSHIWSSSKQEARCERWVLK